MQKRERMEIGWMKRTLIWMETPSHSSREPCSFYLFHFPPKWDGWEAYKLSKLCKRFVILNYLNWSDSAISFHFMDWPKVIVILQLLRHFLNAFDNIEASPHIPKHFLYKHFLYSARLQTRHSNVIIYILSPSLPASASTLLSHHLHISTAWHPIISTLTF